MRVDLLLVKLGLVRSRESAKKLISIGAVFYNGKKISKPSLDIPYEEGSDNDVDLVVTEALKYVSRGGYKLEGILTSANISVKNAVCIDIGASTGGFTDCLLQNGAKKVYCIDSGSGQLHPDIASDKRVVSFEKTNARYLTSEQIPELADIIVMDVSFISQTYLHSVVSRFLKDDGMFITLIKPQFELSRSEIKKGGIVKEKRERHTAVQRVVRSCEENQLFLSCISDSSIKGGDGNIEYTAIFKHHTEKECDVRLAIEKLS